MFLAFMNEGPTRSTGFLVLENNSSLLIDFPFEQC